MKSKSYVWTLPMVKLYQCLVLRILLQMPSSKFMYNQWFSVIQLASTKKEKLGICMIY